MTRAIAVTVAVAVALVACRGEAVTPSQPIAFDHALHVGAEKIPCTDCHPGAELGVRASLPSVGRCLACHMRPQSKEPNPREQAVRDLAASRTPIRWYQVTRNSGHVYFSHRAHVTIAKMPCSDCHGDVTRWKRPPTEPSEALTSMGACIACHRKEGASTSCITCHQ